MKRFFKVKGLIAALAVALTMFLGACGQDENADLGGVDFTNYSTGSAAIRIRNLTDQKLVLFQNELNEAHILGGVDPFAGSAGWGIKKNPDLFATTKEFSMIVLTLDQYVSNKGNLSSQVNKPFTRVYVFYNASGENEILYEISDKIGGNNILQVENPSNLNVELRQGGVNGPTLGYAPAGMQKTTLYVMDGDLDFFPVFKRFNASRNIVETIYPKGDKGQPWMESYVFGNGTPPQSYDIRDALSTSSGRTSGVAYLKFVNQSGGAVRLYKGSEMVYNTAGLSYMSNNGSPVEIEILMPESQGVFDEKVKIANYKVGPTGGSTPIEDSKGNTEFDIYTDKSYTVTITGNYNQGGVKALIDIDKATDVSFDFFTFSAE